MPFIVGKRAVAEWCVVGKHLEGREQTFSSFELEVFIFEVCSKQRIQVKRYIWKGFAAQAQLIKPYGPQDAVALIMEDERDYVPRGLASGVS